MQSRNGRDECFTSAMRPLIAGEAKIQIFKMSCQLCAQNPWIKDIKGLVLLMHLLWFSLNLRA